MGNITCIRGGAIGDFVLALPAINSIQKAFPTKDLQLIGHPATLSLTKARTIINHDDPRLIPLHREGPIPRETLALFADTERVLCYAVDEGKQLAAQLQRAVQGPVVTWDPRPPATTNQHIIEHLLSPLRAWDIPVTCSVPRIELNDGDDHFADTLPSPPQVIIHIGSSSPAKSWPEAHFRTVATTLRQRGWDTAILCGPIEIERGLGEDSLQPPNLRALAGLLARASLFIGNDSGPGHIAAAVGTPPLSLFGPTNPHIWAPRHNRGRFVQALSGRIGEIACTEVIATALQMLEEGNNG